MRQTCVFRQALTNHRDANINAEELFVRVLGKLYFKFPPKIHARTDTFDLRTLRREGIEKTSEPQRNGRRGQEAAEKKPEQEAKGRDVFKALPGTFDLRTLRWEGIGKASKRQRNARRIRKRPRKNGTRAKGRDVFKAFLTSKPQ